MGKTLVSASGWLGGASLLVLVAGVFSFAFGDVFYQQPVVGAVITGAAPNDFAQWSLTGASPIGATGTVNEIRFWARTTNGAGFYSFTLHSYSNSSLTTDEQQHISMPISEYETTSESSGEEVIFTDFTPFQLDASRYYKATISEGTGVTGTLEVFGTSSPDTCSATGCTGTPYFFLLGNDTSNPIATSSRIVNQIEPQNGTTTNSTTVLFRTAWFNNATDGDFDKFQTEISDVTAGYQYAPIQSDVLLEGYATTSHTKVLVAAHYHIWRGCLYNSATFEKRCGGYQSFDVVSASASSSSYFPGDATSTLDEIGDSCTEQDNIFGRALCSAFAFLFTPNQAVLDRWSALPTMAANKFPFSVVTDVRDAFIQDAATSTNGLPTTSIGFHDLNLGSTSPMGNLLPNFDVFSTTTLMQYMPEAVWDAGQTLMAAAFWMASAGHIYATVRRRHAHV